MAGGSNDGNDVEAVAARAAGRPKTTIKRREIFDPSHVARHRTSVAANRQKSPYPHREFPIAHSSPLASLSQRISPYSVFDSPV